MNKIISIIKLLTNRRLLQIFYAMAHKGYMVEKGWMRSAIQRNPTDRDGNPVPWITLSFLDFVTPRLRADMDIFEFGSGNSTLFYSTKVKSVTSVESDPKWYSVVSDKVSDNVVLLFHDTADEGGYCSCARNTGAKFDMIIVDGHSRFKCASESFQALKDDGVVVLDNSNRENYQEIYRLFFEKNFRHIDFWGMAPGALRTNCTTIFYRANNCLSI